MKQTLTITILTLTITLLACHSSQLLADPSQPTLTPTFVLAHFATPILTPPAVSEEPHESGPSTEKETPDSIEAESTPENTENTLESPLVTPEPEEATPTESPPEPEEADPTEPLPETEQAAETESAFESPLEIPTPQDVATAPPPSPPTPTPTDTPIPTPPPLSGRIAFSVDDGGGHYDIWVIELPAGQPFQILSRARQPNFSNDGRLLVNNHDSQYGESLGLLDATYTWQGIINNSPYDAFPYWSPDGSRYTYSNPNLLLDPVDNNPLMHVFIPCSMQIPSMEQNVKCQDMRTNGKVVVGEAPVWTADDRIAFFTFEGDDGIYVVSNASTLWQAGGVGGAKFLVKGNGRPTDTDGFQVFFSAGDIDSNWEAYSIDLDGTNLTNISNAPHFQDGLPTVSPDGNWIAFVSDRDGKWGIWVVPRTGGEPQKVVDFSTINTNPSPWGVDERAWTRERITWGP